LFHPMIDMPDVWQVLFLFASAFLNPDPARKSLRAIYSCSDAALPGRGARSGKSQTRATGNTKLNVVPPAGLSSAHSFP
jgi:hypothetical protein